MVRFRKLHPAPTVPRLPTAWLIALGGTLFFSMAPPIARGAIVAGLPPPAVLIARMAIALALLSGFIALMAPDRLRIDRRRGLIAVGSGLINGIGFVAFFAALSWLDASIASMIFSISPLVVLGLLALRGEPVTRRHFVRLVLGIGGVYLLIGPGGDVDLWGVVLVLIALASYSLHLVIVQWTLAPVPARTVTLYVNTGATITCAIWWLLSGRPWIQPDAAGWASILGLAIFCTFLARLLLFDSVRRLGSGQIAMLSPLETLLTVIWSYLFLAERLTAVQWTGGILIFFSLILAVQRIRLVRRWRPWPRL